MILINLSNQATTFWEIASGSRRTRILSKQQTGNLLTVVKLTAVNWKELWATAARLHVELALLKWLWSDEDKTGNRFWRTFTKWTSLFRGFSMDCVFSFEMFSASQVRCRTKSSLFPHTELLQLLLSTISNVSNHDDHVSLQHVSDAMIKEHSVR